MVESFNSIMKQMKQLNGVNEDNINEYIDASAKLKENLEILRSIDKKLLKIKLSNKSTVDDYKNAKYLLKEQKKYQKNENKIISLYEHYMGIKKGFDSRKDQTNKIVFEKYYECTLIENPTKKISEKEKDEYDNLFKKYFINIEGKCNLIFSNKLVPVVLQNIDDEKRELLSGNDIINITSKSYYMFKKLDKINRNKLVDILKNMSTEDIRLYRDKINNFCEELSKMQSDEKNNIDNSEKRYILSNNN